MTFTHLNTPQVPLPDQKPPLRQLTRWMAVVPPALSVLWVLVCLFWPDVAERAQRTGILNTINTLVQAFGYSPIAWIGFEKMKDAATLHGLASNPAVATTPEEPVHISPDKPTYAG